MVTQATVSLFIAAPPAVVWAWVGDITKHADWSPKPYRVELVSGELNAAGSRYRSVGWVPPNDGEHENDVQLIEVVPERSLVLHATESSGTFTNSFHLAPTVEGTDVTYHLAFPRMTGVAALMVAILFPIVGKSDIRKRMQLLKGKAESSV